MAAKSFKNLQRAQCSNLLQSLISFTSINAMYVNWKEFDLSDVPLSCVGGRQKAMGTKVSRE
jgi:hypothetical protein